VSLVAGLFALSTLLGGCATTSGSNKKSPQDAEWHYKMASGYFESHDTSKAIQHLARAIEMKPDYAEAHFLMGFIYMGRKRYPKAVKHFKKTIDVNPDHYAAQNNLGSVYLATERWDEAATLFTKLIDEQMYPNPELAHNNLGWAEYNMRNYKEALRHFKEATFLKPEMCLAHNNKGLTFKEMGRRTDAISAFKTAIKKCPKNFAEPHMHLAKLLEDRDMRAARRHFERCAQIAQDSHLGKRCRQYLEVW
jgi:tetratricopeptide (TPR) repeat protein